MLRSFDVVARREGVILRGVFVIAAVLFRQFSARGKVARACYSFFSSHTVVSESEWWSRTVAVVSVSAEIERVGVCSPPVGLVLRSGGALSLERSGYGGIPHPLEP